MSSEELVLKIGQVLKDDEERLKTNHIAVTAQIQYNKVLQEKLKALVVEYDTNIKNSKKRSKK